MDVYHSHTWSDHLTTIYGLFNNKIKMAVEKQVDLFEFENILEDALLFDSFVKEILGFFTNH